MVDYLFANSTPWGTTTTDQQTYKTMSSKDQLKVTISQNVQNITPIAAQSLNCQHREVVCGRFTFSSSTSLQLLRKTAFRLLSFPAAYIDDTVYCKTIF